MQLRELGYLLPLTSHQTKMAAWLMRKKHLMGTYTYWSHLIIDALQSSTENHQ